MNNTHPALNEELTPNELDEKPWKYIGYPGFVAYVSSDDGFFLLRRFDKLHSRVLLKLQDNLSVHEESLRTLDLQLSARDAHDVDNGTFRNDGSLERRTLLGTIEKELNSYDKLLLRYLGIVSQPEAPGTGINSLKAWLSNRRGPIHENETRFLEASDLITATWNKKPPLQRFFEQRILTPTVWLFRKRTESGERPNATITLSDRSVDNAGMVSVFTSALAMLIAPLWILAPQDGMYLKLAVITAFTVLFLLIMCWGTTAKQFEIFAATAGYCAVLVVFLQIGDN